MEKLCDTPFESPRDEQSTNLLDEDSKVFEIDKIMKRRKFNKFRNKDSDRVKFSLSDTIGDMPTPKPGKRILNRSAEDGFNESPHGLRLRFAYVDGRHSAQAVGRGHRDVPAGQLLGCDAPKNAQTLASYALDVCKSNLEGPIDQLKRYASTDDLDVDYRPSRQVLSSQDHEIVGSGNSTVKNITRKRTYLVNERNKLTDEMTPSKDREIFKKPAKKYVCDKFDLELIKDRVQPSAPERLITASTDASFSITEGSSFTPVESFDDVSHNHNDTVCDFERYAAREEESWRSSA